MLGSRGLVYLLMFINYQLTLTPSYPRSCFPVPIRFPSLLCCYFLVCHFFAGSCFIYFIVPCVMGFKLLDSLWYYYSPGAASLGSFWISKEWRRHQETGKKPGPNPHKERKEVIPNIGDSKHQGEKGEEA